jgi:hypothetical protein
MKTKLFLSLVVAATVSATLAQTAPAAGDIPANRRSSATINRDEELQNARANLANLQLKYTAVHPDVIAAQRRVEELEGGAGGSVGPVTSGGAAQNQFGTRLNSIVRRGASVPSGSIIMTSPHPQKDIDELSEDLAVLNFIFNQNLERTFGDKGAEYRLGVPITMRDSRLVETSYLQDFGVLVKIHVPFPVIGGGETNKKAEPTAAANSDWEKARRALYGGGDADPTMTAAPVLFDERLVNELKRQMFDALKNAANLRHLEPSQTITVAIIGGSRTPVRTGFGGASDADATRPTILTVRITKSQADEAAKEGGDDLAKRATIITYYDTASVTNVRTAGGGGYGAMNGFGGSVGAFGTGYGYYPSAPAAR